MNNNKDNNNSKKKTNSNNKTITEYNEEYSLINQKDIDLYNNLNTNKKKTNLKDNIKKKDDNIKKNVKKTKIKKEEEDNNKEKKTKKKKSNAGRPSKYFTHIQPNLDDIKAMRMLGNTEAEIAKHFGVAISSWCDYKNKYLELTEALKYTKEHLIRDLAKSIFKQAMGGIKVKQTKKTMKIVNDVVVEKFVEETEKELPPNVAAAIYSLNNLNPYEWTNRYREDLTIKQDDENKNMHEQTILALQKRQVKGFDNEEIVKQIEIEIVGNEEDKDE